MIRPRVSQEATLAAAITTAPYIRATFVLLLEDVLPTLTQARTPTFQILLILYRPHASNHPSLESGCWGRCLFRPLFCQQQCYVRDGIVSHESLVTGTHSSRLDMCHVGQATLLSRVRFRCRARRVNVAVCRGQFVFSEYSDKPTYSLFTDRQTDRHCFCRCLRTNVCDCTHMCICSYQPVCTHVLWAYKSIHIGIE